MAKEFRDFSDDVVDGADRMRKGLDGVVDSARGADSAHSGLSDVQKKATGIANKFAAAQSKASTSVMSSVKSTRAYSKSAGAMSSASKTAATDVGALSDKVSGLNREVAGLADSLDRTGDMKIEIDTSKAEGGIRDLASSVGSMPDISIKSKITVDTKPVEKAATALGELSEMEDVSIGVAVSVDGLADVTNLNKMLGRLPKEKAVKVKMDSSEIEEGVREAAASVDMEIKVDSPDLESAVESAKSASETIKSTVKESQELIEMLEGVRTAAGKAEYLRLNLEVSGLEAIDSFLGTLDESQAAMFDARAAAVGYEQAVEELSASFPILATRIERASAAAEEIARTSSTLSNELEKQGDAMDGLVDKYNEGVRSAESFLGGIGATQGALVGAGVAVAFLATKLVGVIGEFQSAAVEAAEFAVELSSVERQTFGGVTGEMAKIRDELNLTRGQSKEFFDLLISGSASGVASVDELVGAAANLRDAFGGDQRERLQEYVNLLEKLPDIEADLEIGANFDDQAAALFALAQEGEVQTLIDLQAAGLAGGIAIEANKEEVGLLNSAQNTEQTVESIQEGLAGFYPQVGPPIAALGGGVAKGIALLAGGVATLAALKIFFGKGQTQIRQANEATESAVESGTGDIVDEIRKSRGEAAKSKDGGGGGGDGGGALGGAVKLKAIEKIFGKAVAKRGLGRAGSRAAISIGGKIGGKSGAMAAGRLASGISQAKSGDLKGIARAAKGIGQLGKASLSASTVLTSVGKGLLTFAKSGAGVGLILGAAGLAVEHAAGMFGDVTKDTGAAMGKFAGKMLQAAGTVAGLAAIGQALVPIPGLGAAIGAIVGVVVSAPGVLTAGFDALAIGAKNAGDDLNGTFESVDGKQIQKYNVYIQAAGTVLQDFSGMMSDASNFVTESMSSMGQSVKETAQGIGMLAKENKKLVGVLFPFAGAIMGISGAVDLFKESIQGEGVAEEMARIKVAGESLDRSLSRLDKTTQRLNASEAKEFKRVQEVAISLQRELGRTKATFEGIKFALADFESELASADLKMFQEIGGTVAGFDKAIGSSSDAIKNKFSQVAGALDQRRASIISNSGLDAKARKNALDDLHKREIAAVAEFAEGISSLVDQMMNAPDILTTGFKEAAREAEFNFIGEGGIEDVDKIFSGINEGIKNTGEQFDRNVEQGLKAVGLLIDQQDELKKKSDDSGKKLLEVFSTLPEAVKKSLGGVVAEDEEGKLSIKKSGVADAASEIAADLDKARDELSNLEDKLDGFNVSRIQAAYSEAADAQAAATNNVKQLDEQLVELKEEQSKLVKKGKDSLEVSKKITEAEKRKADEIKKATDAANKTAEMEQKFVDGVAKSGVKQEQAKKGWAGIVDRQGVANKDLEEITKVVDVANELTKENRVGQEERRKELDGELDALEQTNAAMQAMAGFQKNQVQLAKEVGKLAQNRVDLAKSQASAVEKFTEAIAIGTRAQERALAEAQMQAASAELTGNAISATSDVYRNNVKLQSQQSDIASRAIAEAVKTQKKFEDVAKEREKEAVAARAAADAVGDDDPGKRGKEMVAEELEATARVASAGAKKAANAASDLRKSAAEASTALLDSLTDISGVLSKFENSLSGRRIEAELDLGNSLMELASFSNDFEKVTTDSFNIVMQTAKREAQFRRHAVEERIKDAEAAAEAEAQAMESRGNVGGASQLREEMAATLQAKKRAELAKIETQEKKKVLQAAEAAASLALAAIDVEESLNAAEMDFLTEMGGSFESVLALQNQSVDLEREKLRIANQNFERARAAGVSGVELRKLEVAAQIQGINVQKKAMGVQKGLFEEMIAGAFGQLDSNFGARRQRFSEVAMLGREGSRVRRRSGIRTGGETQTIAERAASRMLGDGKRDTAKGNILGAGGGVLGTMGPSKKTEEKIFDAATKNLEENKKAAGKIAALSDAGTTPGSIFTHDTTAEARLDMLIDAIKVLQGEDILDEDNLNRTIAGADNAMETNGLLESLLEVGKGIFDAMGLTAEASGDENLSRGLAILGASVEGGLKGIQIRGVKSQAAIAKAQSEGAQETAGVKDAVEKAADKSKKAADKPATAASQAAKEGMAAGVATGQAVKDGIQEQRKATGEQLGVARQELKASMAQLKALKDSGKTDEFDKAAAETEAKLMRVVDLEKQVRVQESRNPIAGAAPQIAEIGRVLSGGLPEQVEEFEGLVSSEKEVAGRAAETERKRQDVTQTQEDIAEGREPAPEVNLRPGEMGLSDEKADELDKRAKKMFGDEAMARRPDEESAGVAGGVTASGQRAFLGGVTATAQAQLDAGIGAGGAAETRGETIERLKAAAATDEGTITAASGMFQKEFDVTGGQLAVQTPETRQMEAQDRKEQLARLRGETPAEAESTSESAMAAAGDVSDMPEKMQAAIERARTDREANIAVAQSTPNMTTVPEETVTSSRREEVTNRSREVAGAASQAPQTSFATVAGAPGSAAGGGGLSSTAPMKVQGELVVRFTGIPKSYAATIVGEVINTPEVLKSIQDNGFLRK